MGCCAPDSISPGGYLAVRFTHEPGLCCVHFPQKDSKLNLVWSPLSGQMLPLTSICDLGLCHDSQLSCLSRTCFSITAQFHNFLTTSYLRFCSWTCRIPSKVHSVAPWVGPFRYSAGCYDYLINTLQLRGTRDGGRHLIQVQISDLFTIDL